MSEELIEQLKMDERFADLSPGELQRIADLTAKLRGISLFDSLEDLELAYIAQKGREIHRERGDMIIRQGDTDKVFYVVLSGQLRVWKTDQEDKKLLDYHEQGDFCGELIFIESSERTANVDVMEDADLVTFDQEGFERIVYHPQISNYLRELGPQRLQLSNEPFKGKQWDEITLVRARKSWLALARMIAFPATIILLTFAVWAVLSAFTQVLTEVMISVTLAVVVGMGLWMAWMWEDWRNDDFIVTSKRVIHIERVLIPPFPLERHEAAIEQVQDIATRNQGIWTVLFDVHTLEIRTSGEGTIRFSYLTDVDRIREEIFHARDLARARKLSEERSRIRDSLYSELGLSVKKITPLESDQEPEITPKPTGLMVAFDYFIPRMKIVERDRITWRRHWLFLVGKVLAPVLASLLSLAALIFAFVRPGPLNQLPRYVAVPVPALAALCTFVWYLWQYDGWRNDVYIVTDERIVDIEGSPFHLRKETRTEGPFDVIQNVDYNSPNWFYRALRIGDVTIDTAAEQKAYTFDSVPRPEEVQQEIFRRWVAYQESKERRESERRYSEFARWFETYHRSVVQPKE